MTLITLHTQYTDLTRGKHSEHSKAEAWPGEEEQHGQSRANCPSLPVQKEQYWCLLERKGSTRLNRKTVYKSVKFWHKSEINLHCGVSAPWDNSSG